MGHLGPKNDTYFWICSKKTRFSLVVGDRGGNPPPPKKILDPPPPPRPKSPIDEKLKGDPPSTNSQQKKNLEKIIKKLYLKLKKQKVSNQKFKIFHLWQAFMCFSIPKHLEIWRFGKSPHTSDNPRKNLKDERGQEVHEKFIKVGGERYMKIIYIFFNFSRLEQTGHFRPEIGTPL